MITPDGETEAFNILAGVLQGDTLVPYLSVITKNYSTDVVSFYILAKGINQFLIKNDTKLAIIVFILKKIWYDKQD